MTVPNHYSVIIPAFNEEAVLADTLNALRAAMVGIALPGEIIVVDNNSTDRTARIAGDHGARVVFEPVNQISRARNAGAAAARGRYLFFLDADTLVKAELLVTALEDLVGGDFCGGGSTLEFDRPVGWAQRLVDAWNWISVRFGFAAGSFVYCLSDGFRTVGGFSEAVYAGEEIWFSRRLKKWGRERGLKFRIVEHAPVVTSGRKLDWYTPFSLLLLVVLFALFPAATRFRSFCGHWYKRPTV